MSSTAASDFASLAARFEVGEEGNERGCRGLYRGGIGEVNGGFNRRQSTREDRRASGRNGRGNGA